jgi:hypothetical protein
MSPEFADRLIILDFVRVEKDNLIGSMYYIDPPKNQELRVRWGRGDLPDKFISVAEDLAFVSTQDDECEKVKIEKIEKFSMESFNDFHYQLSEGLKRDLDKLMVILTLPESYTLSDTEPEHHGIRDFNGRIAIYWVLLTDKLKRTNVNWTITSFNKQKEDIKAVIKKINVKYHSNYRPILPAQVEKIFLSYRRSDSPAMLGRIFDRLVQEFGKEAVFRDIHSIKLGVNFRKFITEQIVNCRVMLVVIGDQWLDAKDESGNRRLDDPNDI